MAHIDYNQMKLEFEEHSAAGVPEVDETTERINANIFPVLDGKLGVEAIEDKILIKVDRFKIGNECKLCKDDNIRMDATGKEQYTIITKCKCVLENHPGVKYTGSNIPCHVCNGNYEAIEKAGGIRCPDCDGKGVTTGIVITQNMKKPPTTGVIVSVGEKVKIRKIGERVIFGPHTGLQIPFKGATLRVMREYEPLAVLYTNVSENKIGTYIEPESEDTQYTD